MPVRSRSGAAGRSLNITVAHVLAASVVLAGSALQACAQSPQIAQDSVWLVALAKATPCAEKAVIAARPKEMNAKTACVLTASALRQIATGNARSHGVEASDTAKVKSAQIAAQHFRGLNSTPDAVLWSVHIEFTNRKPAIDVTFDRVNKKISTSIAEHGDRP